MRLYFIFIHLSFVVSAKKPKHNGDNIKSTRELRKPEEDYERSIDLNYQFSKIGIDFRGSVRQLFALEAALANPESNMVCSPVSVLMPLGKLVLGAEAQSEKELLQAVGVKYREEISTTFKEMISTLEFLPGVRLDMASRLFISSERGINKSFLRNTKEIFKSTCQKIDAKDPSKSSKTINDWVAVKTNNKIKRLISPNDINRDTSLILVNAIYFLGNWKDKFDRTYSEHFYAPSGRRRVPMMTRTGTYKYSRCDTLNAQIIELPYEVERAAMVVILPFSKQGLPVLLRSLKLAPELLNEALLRLTTTQVKLSLPKFKIESSLDLISLYKKVGVSTIFGSMSSQLTGILDDDKVFVTKAVHKAIIEVNERGTEASAATGIFSEALSAIIPKSIEFNANHPFMFYVKGYREQLFAGIYNG